MTELFQAAISAENIIYTLLLAIVILYWFSVIAGALDMNAFDVEIDIDADLDLDLDADVDGAGGTSGWLAGALHFFNFGKLPTMVILSFVILFAWMINVLMNHYLGGGSLVFALMLMLPNLFISLLFTKIITTPLIPIFQQLNTPEENIDFIGMLCKLTVTANKTKKGQAEVIHQNSSILIYVKVDEDEMDDIKKGEKAIILRPSKDASYFLIRKPTEIVF